MAENEVGGGGVNTGAAKIDDKRGFLTVGEVEIFDGLGDMQGGLSPEALRMIFPDSSDEEADADAEVK